MWFVDRVEEEEDEEEVAVFEEIGGKSEDDTSNGSSNAEALFRRLSAVSTHLADDKHAVVEKWLDQTSSSSGPPPSSRSSTSYITSTLPFPDAYTNIVDSVKDEQEHAHGIRTTCPFCSLHWDEMTSGDQAAHMLSHNSTPSPISQPHSATFGVIGQNSRNQRCNLPRIKTITTLDDDAEMLADVDTPIKPRHQRNKKKKKKKLPLTKRKLAKRDMQRRGDGLGFLDAYGTSPLPLLGLTSTGISPAAPAPQLAGATWNKNRASPALSDTKLPPLRPLSSGKRKRKRVHSAAESARERCASMPKKRKTGVAMAGPEYEGRDTGSVSVGRVVGGDGNVLGDEHGAGEGVNERRMGRCVVS